MDRRTLLTASVAMVGSTVSGCLESRRVAGSSENSGRKSGKPNDTKMNNSSDGNGSADNETKKSSETDDPGNNNEVTSNGDSKFLTTNNEDTISDLEHHFEVLNTEYVGNPAERASVTFRNHTIDIIGAVSGSNSCYTARLDAVTTEDKTLVIQIESFENADENEGCRAAIIEIEYQLSVRIPEELPASIRVEHNDKLVTTEPSP